MTKTNNGTKVLHIITLFSVGGATENTLFTCEGLINKGYDVHLATGPNISSEGSMYETAEKMNVPVYTFPHIKRQISPFSDIYIIFQLYRFIKKHKYDIVHTHSTKAGVVGRIASWLARTPVIIHSNHAVPYHRYQSWFQQTVYKQVEKFAGLFCHKIVSVTHTIVDDMVNDKLVPREKFIVIRSGFEIDKFVNYDKKTDSDTRKKFNLSENDIIIGKIARLSVIKGHKYIIEAFEEVSRQVPNVKLLLVGDGENKDNLEKLISEKNLNDKIIFSGLVPPEEIPSIISILDIVVHTALLEGLPRVFAQSMLMGKPVVAFDLDGAHEVISDGKNGYLIEPMNIKMLQEKIIDLASNLEKAREFGEYARINLEEDFSKEAMVEANDKLYRELLSK